MSWLTEPLIQAECVLMYMVSFRSIFSLSVLSPLVLLCGFLLYNSIVIETPITSLTYIVVSIVFKVSIAVFRKFAILR